jgi:CHAT domain-containing protein
VTTRTPFEIPAGVLAVAYSVHGDTLLVLSGVRGALDHRIVPGANSLIERCQLWRDFVTDPSSGEAHRAAGARLCNDLLGPELAAYPGRPLLIVPDGALWTLPFTALILPDGTYLGARTQVTLIPSLATLQALSARPHGPGRDLLALAGGRFDGAAGLTPDAEPLSDLAATAAEADLMRSLDRNRATILDEASEADFKALDPGRYQLIHFATHSLPDLDHPGRSSIVLGAGGGEDGFLQAREIARLPLDCRMVVVSGCASGRGRTVAGEGQLGLAHALLSAGVHSAVLSGWNVTDAGAAGFMEAFYAALPGHTVGEAVQRARVRMLASDAWSHPAHWAAFQVAGDAEQRLELPERRSVRSAIVMVTGVLLVAILRVFHIRKKHHRV